MSPATITAAGMAFILGVWLGYTIAHSTDYFALPGIACSDGNCSHALAVNELLRRAFAKNLASRSRKPGRASKWKGE
jgi:hypothetical protein